MNWKTPDQSQLSDLFRGQTVSKVNEIHNQYGDQLMKKLIAVAGLVSLAACGGSADEPGEAEDLDTAAAEVIPSTSAGTYSSTTEDGTEVSVNLNADGSYAVVQGGETVESGTWEDNIRGTCLTAEGGDGEDCWNIQPGAEEGMMDITGGDGETMSYSYES